MTTEALAEHGNKSRLVLSMGFGCDRKSTGKSIVVLVFCEPAYWLTGKRCYSVVCEDVFGWGKTSAGTSERSAFTAGVGARMGSML